MPFEFDVLLKGILDASQATQQAVQQLVKLTQAGAFTGAAGTPVAPAPGAVDLTPLTSLLQALVAMQTPQAIQPGSLTGVPGATSGSTTGLFPKPFLVPQDGTINIMLAINLGSAGTTLQLSVDGGNTYDEVNVVGGGALNPGAWYAFPVPVKRGWSVQFAPGGTGTTTFDAFGAWFLPIQGVNF